MSEEEGRTPNEIRRKKIVRKIAFVFIATLGFVLVAEVLLRLIGGVSPDPAKLDTRSKLADFVQSLEWDINLEKSSGGSFYIEDPDLLWKLRPGFEGWARDFFIMTVTDHAPRWHFKINKRGFRGPDFEDNTQPGTYRIVCLGDSCMFGFGVDDEDTFPATLKAELEAHCPACRFEVINMGLPGYSSRQRIELAKRWIARLSPKMVIIAYGTNDWWHREMTDDEAMQQARTSGAALGRFMRRFALGKFMSSLLTKKAATENKNAILPSRVSKTECEENIGAIAQLASQHGAKVMLANMNFYIPYGTEALKNISKRKPEYFFVDAVEFLAEKLRDINMLRSAYPVDSALAQRIYGDEIKRRPIFYVMADPVHPNALGHRLITQRCASVIFGPDMMPQMLDLMTSTIESLPNARAMGAEMLSPTALEERIAATVEKKIH